MVSRDFSRRSLHSCKHAVYGGRRRFRVLDQSLGRRWRRRRMHRRCIGCEENTRQGSSPRTRPQEMNHGPISKPSKVHFLVRPGSHFPAPAVRFATARRARLSQCWPPLRRPPAGLGIDQPSTVLRLQEAVTVIGTVLFAILLSCGSDRRPQGPRPAPSGQAGLGRAANARRAAERGPRPFGEEPPNKTRFRCGSASRPVRRSPPWSLGCQAVLVGEASTHPRDETRNAAEIRCNVRLIV